VNKSTIPKTDYSKIAEYYDRLRLVPTEELLSRIIEYGGIDGNSAVLDVGCGTGRFPLNMPATRNLYCALEPSIEMLSQAVEKDRSRRIQWIRGDCQNLPFKDNVFTCVYMTAVIHHIENKHRAMDEVHRVLKSAGKCVIMTFSHGGIRKHILRDFPGVTRMDLRRVPSVPFVKTMMTAAGFRDIHYHLVRQDEGYLPTAEYLERVRNKYISTLTLFTEEEFQNGLKTFEKKVRKKYGDRIRKISQFVFVVGKRPSP